jgi:hypothetical protein
MNKVYSQAFALLSNGERSWFNPEEIKILERNNQQFMHLDNLEEAISETFEPALREDSSASFVTASGVLEILKEKNLVARYLNVVDVGRKMNLLKFEKVKKNGIYCYPVKKKD